MKIVHDTVAHRAYGLIEGQEAEVIYRLSDGGLDIVHTYVPTQLEGRGIASQLVMFVYDYALSQGWKLKATCSYAKMWLKNNPVYQKYLLYD